MKKIITPLNDEEATEWLERTRNYNKLEKLFPDRMIDA